MKVALVTYFPDDPGTPHGGVEAVSVNLAKALSDYDDLQVHVVTGRREKGASVAVLRWGKVTVHKIPTGGGSVIRNAVCEGRRRISSYLNELAPDLVHAHDTFGLMVKGLPLPRVFTIHGFIYSDTLVSGEKLPWLRSVIWKKVEMSGWADQPHIISISPYVRERLAGITRGVIHDIDNPISDTFFNIRREEKEGTIFSAALICNRKNTLKLIDAFSVLVSSGIDAELRLAGPVTEVDYGRQVQARIKEFGLEGRVVLLGRITTDQVRSELAKASVFALVSLEENSPMGIEEAMAAGVPVVTSNRCGMPYMVRHGESGFLVDPMNPQDIAWRLKMILENRESRKAMGDQSRAIAEDRFHPNVVARRTRDVYREAVGAGNAG